MSWSLLYVILLGCASLACIAHAYRKQALRYEAELARIREQMK